VGEDEDLIRVEEGPQTIDNVKISKFAPNKFSIVKVVNTDAANSVYYRSDGIDPTAAAPTPTLGGFEIPPSQARVVILTPKSGDAVLKMIAATAPVVVGFQKLTFRNNVIAAIIAAASYVAVFLQQQLIAVVNSTTLKLAGAYLTLRADTYSAKTPGTAVTLTPLAQADGVIIGAPGSATFAAPTRIGPSANDFLEIGTNGFQLRQNNGVQLYADNTSVLQLRNAYSLILQNGAGADPRHTFTPTEQVLHTPVAGGNISQTKVSREFPIVNAALVSVNDLVEIAPNSSNRVQKSAIASANLVIGVCTAGGTGNPAGTVFGRVMMYGYLTGVLIADTPGVTAGQFIKPGANTSNRVISAAASAAGAFGICLLTASAGNPTDVFITGPRSPGA
jgi:hypothetical protein